MTIDINGLTVANIATVADLINWSEAFTSPSVSGKPRRWAYRGQPREFYTLTPSFQRLFSPSSYGAAELIEKELISAFRKHYEVLPDRSPDMPQPAAIVDGFDLRCLSVMQHYEVPTRLLDWTSEFWIAVYFACASDPDHNAELWLYDRHIFTEQLSNRGEHASLLCGDVNPPKEPILLPCRNEQLLVELDPRLTPRMRTQFAHHTVSANILDDHAILLNDLQSSLPPTEEEPWHFRRFVIAKSCKSNTLRFLSEHRKITASTIFPDVVGLGRFLRWHLDSLRTILL